MFRSCVGRWRVLAAFVLWLSPTLVSAESVTLAWDPSEGAAGYTVKWGTALGSYPNSADAGAATQLTLTGLVPGATYWAVARAYNGSAVSEFSAPLQFTVPSGTLPCSYSISPANISISNAAASGVVNVTTQSGCAWSATSSSAFLTFQNGTGRVGSGSVTFAAAANTATSPRIGTGTIAGNAFAVAQAAASSACTYAISPASVSLAAAATTGTINVTTQAGCAWSATSGSAFLSFSNGTGRTGSGSVTFAVTANSATSARTGTATVAGKSFSVSQSAAAPQSCSYAISPASTSVPAAPSAGMISVTTQEGCAWSASSASSFLTFPNGSGRTGSGSVDYAVAQNTGAFRTGTGTVAGKSFTIYQAAQGCTYAISPERVSVPAETTTGTITVTTQEGCAWTARGMNDFITFENGTGRSGPGSVTFTIAANTTTSVRTGIGAVAANTFVVTQAEGGEPSTAPPPTSSPAPWSSDFNGDGKNDLLLQHSTTGEVEAWFLDNATVTGTQALSHTMDANWMLVGRGDFNADGKPDLVWQHKTEGWIYLWYMNGTTRISETYPSISRIADPQWKVVGVGDFNADQQPDLVWQHTGNGTLAVWQMVGTTVTATVNIVPSGAADLLWKVVGTGDFNGDGSTDLLWRHMGTGNIAAWLMDGVSRIVHAPLSPLAVTDQRWQIGAVTDANGDGKPDIVWEHTNGTIMIWHMNGTKRGTYPVVPTPVPLGWHLVGPK